MPVLFWYPAVTTKTTTMMMMVTGSTSWSEQGQDRNNKIINRSTGGVWHLPASRSSSSTPFRLFWLILTNTWRTDRSKPQVLQKRQPVFNLEMTERNAEEQSPEPVQRDLCRNCLACPHTFDCTCCHFWRFWRSLLFLWARKYFLIQWLADGSIDFRQSIWS